MLHVSVSCCPSCTFLSIINSIYSLIYFYPTPLQASQRVLSCVLLSAFILCVPTCQMLISVLCMPSCCCFSRSLLLTEALCAFFCGCACLCMYVCTLAFVRAEGALPLHCYMVFAVSAVHLSLCLPSTVHLSTVIWQKVMVTSMRMRRHMNQKLVKVFSYVSASKNQSDGMDPALMRWLSSHRS